MNQPGETSRKGEKKPMTGYARLPYAAALILLLAACSRDGDMPKPPPSTPRPTTSGHYGGGHASTLQLDLSELPAPAPPGEM